MKNSEIEKLNNQINLSNSSLNEKNAIIQTLQNENKKIRNFEQIYKIP